MQSLEVPHQTLASGRRHGRSQTDRSERNPNLVNQSAPESIAHSLNKQIHGHNYPLVACPSKWAIVCVCVCVREREREREREEWYEI